MKKIFSIITLILMIWSSLSVSLITYAKNIESSSDQSNNAVITSIPINIDPLLDRGVNDALSGGELALRYIHGKITLYAKKYIIAHNATDEERGILTQIVPESNGGVNDELIKNIIDQKIKVIEDIFNRPLSKADFQILNQNLLSKGVGYIEMGLSGRELANIWQTKLTEDGFNYLVQQNTTRREKRIIRENRSTLAQLDEAGAGHNAVLVGGSGDSLNLLIRVISRGITKSQLQYMVNNNLIDYELNDDLTVITNESESNDGILTNVIETPEEREKRLKAEEEERIKKEEEEKAKREEEEKRKIAKEQEKNGGLSEESLVELLINHKINIDGLLYLGNLKGLTKDELSFLIMSNEELNKLKNRVIGLSKLKFESKLDKIYENIYKKLSKGGLNKEQAIELQQFIIKEVIKKKKPKVIHTNTENNQEGNEQQENTGDKYQYNEDNNSIGVHNPSFIAKRNDISKVGNGAYQVNFKGITANGLGNNLKAGEVQAVFKAKNNFPKKLILPEGFTYDIKTDSIDSEFIKTRALQDRINNLGVDVGQIHIQEPELRILPDRIQYVKKTTLVFETDTQLQNIKNNLSEQFGNENINSMINDLKNVQLQTVQTLQSGKTLTRINNQNLSPIKNDLFGKKKPMPALNIANMANGYNGELYSKAPGTNKINTNVFAHLNNLSDDEMTNIIEEECNNNSSLTTEQKNSCANAENFEKILETEEVIAYSLIPTTLEDIRNNKKSLISLDPKDIVLTKANIMKRFADLKEINESRELVGDDYRNINSTGSVTQVDVYSNPNFCNIKYGTGTTESTKCQTAKDEMMKVTPSNFSQDLLNGFTIGETKKYSWDTSASVYIPFVGSIKIFKVRFGFSYGYAFGIRIPIHVEGGVSDNKVYAYSDNLVNKGSYDTWIKADTLDGDQQYYQNVLDDENDYHVYEGKEFVFEFTASADIYVWVKGIGGTTVDIPLVSSLIVGLVAVSMLANDGDVDKSMSDVASMFGLQKGNAASLITYGITSFFEYLIKIGKSDSDGGMTFNIGITKGEFITLFNMLANLAFEKYGTDRAKFNKAMTKVTSLLERLEVDEYGYVTNLNSIKNFFEDPKVDIYLNYLLTLIANAFQEMKGLTDEQMATGDTFMTSLNIFATIVQSKILTHMVQNNGIDMSKNFKPPFGDETIPLYRLESPEIPLYNDGLLKLVAKLGVKSELGGRITTKCSEVNSEGACPTNRDSEVEISSSETVITQGYDDSRLHINDTSKYIGSGYAVDGDEALMEEDDLGKYSKFGIKLSDFRYHPELIFTLFAKAGAGVHLPYIGWATYRTPDIDLYTFKFSSDNLYLGQHEGTVGVFDMTQTVDGEVNKVYTVSPPEMKNIENMSYGDDNGMKYLTISPKMNTLGGNHVYYTTYQKEYNPNIVNYGTVLNRASIPECASINNTKIFKEGESNIWPNYKTDLFNRITVDVKAIACNNLYKTKSDIKAARFELKNTYHIPFYILEDQNSTPKGFTKITKGTTLDIDRDEGLYLTMNSKSLEGEINKSDDTHEYIKYKISDSKDIDLNCTNGTLYNGEKFMFSRRDQGTIEDGIISIGDSAPIREYGPGATKYMEIVKCATKDDGSIFESYHNKMTIMAWSSAANNAFKDKAHGTAVLEQVKAILEALGDFRSDLLGGFEKVGGGMNPLEFYGSNGYSMMSVSTRNMMSAQLDIIFDGGDRFDGFDTGNYGQHQIQTMGFTGGTPAGGEKQKGNQERPQQIIGGQISGLSRYSLGKPESTLNLGIIGGGNKLPIVGNDKLSSNDEYVNEKLNEINDCFKTTYDGHLDNIDKTIYNFTKSRDKSREEKVKSKYQKAINKLEEIKEIFINRYKFLSNY